MEDSVNSRDLFVSIRTANRLAYEYQKRILEFMSYFRMKFRLEENRIAGIKRDSDPIGRTQAYTKDDYEDANLKVWTNMWAWDFIYTNLMEYYFGWTKRNRMEFCLSFLQMTDSGYYESSSEKKSWTAVSKYMDVERSHSYGFFILECHSSKTRKYESLWNVDRDGIEQWVKSTDDIVEYKENDKSQYLVFRFNMEDIINQSSTDMVLSRFADIVRHKTGIELIEAIG